MKYQRFNDTYVLRLEKGEEIVSSLKKFCEKENIKLGSIEGLGATNHLVVGLFDLDEKIYHKKEFNEPFEITSLLGNISTMNDEVYLHLHINCADKNMNVYGGHLYECTISVTCELFVRVIDGKVDRYKDEAIGINLYDLKETSYESVK